MMLDQIEIVCPTCRETFMLPIEFVKETITMRRFVKVVEVARQLHEKRGPFYDRWLAAMEVRGEQKRCKDCDDLDEDEVGFYCRIEEDETINRNPGAFVCSEFHPKGGRQ